MPRQGARLGWRPSVLAALLVYTAVSAQGVLAAPAAAGWSRPTTVAAFGFEPVAMAGTGEIVFHRIPRIFSVVRSGTTFSSPRRLSVLPEDPGVFSAPFEVRTDGLGRALLAIRRYDGKRTRLTLAQRSRTGRWTQLRGVNIGREIAGPYIAVNPSGAAVVTWAARRKRGWRIEAITRARSGQFGAPRVLSGTHGNYPWSLRPAVGAGGDALVTWQWQDEGRLFGGFRNPVWAVHAAPGGGWSPEQPLGHSGDDARIAFSVSPAGRMLVAWLPSFLGAAQVREPSRLEIAERPVGGPFAPSRRLATSIPAFIEHGGPVAAVADDGRALVAWARPSTPTVLGTGLGDLEAFTRPAGGDFAAQDLTAGAVQADDLVLAEGGDGNVALGWTERRSTPNARPRLLFSVGTLGAPLPGPATVATATDYSPEPTAAITTQHEVIAAWTADSGAIGAAIHRP
jgi:hypothetical protein